MGLGEGIFEGTACVADGVPSHLLGTVEVAQSHIVEALEEGDVDAVHPAHAGLFALADRRPGYELVGHQHVPAGGVGCAGVQHTADGVVVALDLLVREDVPHGGGLQKGRSQMSTGPYSSVRVMGAGGAAKTGLTYTRLPARSCAPKAMRSAESWLPLTAKRAVPALQAR